ncbi:MAG: N4-gp56 family major capsid protein [Burkholderiales bacterium]|nr:N4-gp56 family major capsid protein [Burkholderiales bacterium]
MPNTYGDITPRTAAYAAATMLERALPFLCMAKFGQQQPIPKNKSLAVKFRRYNGFTPSTTALTEGVTPAADNISSTDVTATLAQYGRRTQITDVIADTHEDPVLNEYAEIMGELAGQTQELVVFNAIRGGTNVIYSGGTSRATVNSAITTTALNRAIRQLKRQNAKAQTRMLAASDKVDTKPIRPSFIAFCHPDLQMDLEALAGFIPVANYGTQQPLGDNELGSYKELRFMSSTLYAPWLQAGASGSTLLTNGASGTGNADVYPIIIVGRDSYATVSLAGAQAVTPIVVNPKPSDSDPLAQRGHVGFKMYSTAVILNDAWMVRIETGVNA